MFLFSLLLFSELFVVFIGKYYGHENNYNIALTTELEITFYLTIFVLKWFDFLKQALNLKFIKNDFQNIVFANFIAEENRLQWAPLNGITDNGNNREYKKIYPDWQVPNHSLIPNFTLKLIYL